LHYVWPQYIKEHGYPPLIKKLGYKILERNYRIRGGEIDIVAMDKNFLVFIEVKTRISQIYGPAEEAFALAKSNRFKRGIEMFIKNNKISADDIRADLIAVDINRLKKTAKIKHFKDIL